MYSYKLEKRRHLKTLYSHLYQRLYLNTSPQISLFEMMSKYYELGSEDLKLRSFFGFCLKLLVECQGLV